MAHAIETVDLVRDFRTGKKREGKSLRALDGVNLQVAPGELFGLLGPNGAGKTTLIKILVTLLYPTAGIAKVDGLDVTRDVALIRQRINMVSGGEYSGYGILTVRETLWMFSQFYGIPYKTAFQRINHLLEVAGLTQDANTRQGKLSTGTRQKMNFCRGFVTDPKILFLDEPTLGMDVSAARDIRAYIKTWMAEHPERNILLTTHYMAEADELCDRVAIIDHGRILACDTPANLKRRVSGGTLFEAELGGLRSSWEELRGYPGVRGLSVDASAESGRTLLKFVLDGESTVQGLINRLGAEKLPLLSLRTTEPTLEDVFIVLVGRGLTDENGQRD
jgi:ABC-2 type transport system ATP-binding protein